MVKDYSYDGVLRQLESSLERLGLERVDMALIHDPDDLTRRRRTAPTAPWTACGPRGSCGPLNSGILADPHASAPMFNNMLAEERWIQKARAIDAVCRAFRAPLKAAALQFPLMHPAAACVLTGARSAGELQENLRMLAIPIPWALWEALKEKAPLAESAPVS